MPRFQKKKKQMCVHLLVGNTDDVLATTPSSHVQGKSEANLLKSYQNDYNTASNLQGKNNEVYTVQSQIRKSEEIHLPGRENS